MGSIVLSEVGGHHFHTSMFGGAGTHQQTQESPAVHHTPVRPSSQMSGHPPSRIIPPVDTPMADSAPQPSSSTPGQRAQRAGNPEPSPHGSSPQQHPSLPPPSPRVQP